MKITSKTINYTVGTVEELSTIVGQENDVIIVTDENRGGTFVYRSAEAGTNNSGTIFNGWVRQYDGAVNVKWFGAKGDGVTDDTLLINSAKAIGDIIIDRDTISTSTSMTSYYGTGTVYSSAGVLNTKFTKIGSIGTDSDVRLRKILGVIRQDTRGSGWYVLNDSGHKSVGLSDITESGDNIILNYNFSSSKVGTLLISPDETFGAFDIVAGASVGTTSANISFSGTLEAEINPSTFSVAASSYFNGAVSIRNNGDSTATITHDTVGSASGAVSLVDKTSYKTIVVSKTATEIVVKQLGQMSGYISWDGSSWVVTTGAKSKPTMSFSAGVLTVTHEAVSAAETTPVISVRSGSCVAQPDSFGATIFSVVFRDFAGTLITSETTSMRFMYHLPALVQVENMAGNFLISRPHCKIRQANLFGATSNFWVSGEMIV